jgi:hypothetical protein
MVGDGIEAASRDSDLNLGRELDTTQTEATKATWLQTLKDELNASRPVIVVVNNGQDLGWTWSNPYPHIFVVSGYNANKIIYHDPWDGVKHDLPVADFGDAWGSSAGGNLPYSYMLVVPTGPAITTTSAPRTGSTAAPQSATIDPALVTEIRSGWPGMAVFIPDALPSGWRAGGVGSPAMSIVRDQQGYAVDFRNGDLLVDLNVVAAPDVAERSSSPTAPVGGTWESGQFRAGLLSLRQTVGPYNLMLLWPIESAEAQAAAKYMAEHLTVTKYAAATTTLPPPITPEEIKDLVAASGVLTPIGQIEISGGYRTFGEWAGGYVSAPGQDAPLVIFRWVGDRWTLALQLVGLGWDAMQSEMRSVGAPQELIDWSYPYGD